VGEAFRNRPDRPWGPPKLLYNEDRVSFIGVSGSDVALATQLHIVQRLKKDQSFRFL